MYNISNIRLRGVAEGVCVQGLGTAVSGQAVQCSAVWMLLLRRGSTNIASSCQRLARRWLVQFIVSQEIVFANIFLHIFCFLLCYFCQWLTISDLWSAVWRLCQQPGRAPVGQHESPQQGHSCFMWHISVLCVVCTAVVAWLKGRLLVCWKAFLAWWCHQQRILQCVGILPIPFP